MQPIAQNRKARHKYEILETVEAGLVLRGSEVKSLRNGQASLNEAYARIRNGEAWLVGAHIPPYPQAGPDNHEPERARKLLLHRRELDHFEKATAQKGFTLTPLKLYFKEDRAKVEIALARGKTFGDKRRAEREKDAKREMDRARGSRRQ